MSCEQKSGVFLKEPCNRTVTNSCANCEKKICHVHFHHFEANDLCEDCYWERYLYAEPLKQNDTDVDYYEIDSTISTTTTSYSSSDTEEAGFDGGFGGGGFGGGGASGSWTAGEAQGFNETDAGGGLLDNDDTFYYS